MDDYVEYKIITGEDESDDSSDDNSGGCAIWVMLIIIALWIIGKLFS